MNDHEPEAAEETGPAPSTTVAGLASALESILFVSAEPVSLERIKGALECDDSTLQATSERLAAELRDRGVRLQQSGDGLQLVSAPENAAAVERFLGIHLSARPSAAGLEVLAVVAYHQPVGRPRIEEIRGVNSDRAIRALVAQGLIQEVGRGSGLGRPVLYGTTEEFLQRFGLESLTTLPEIDDQVRSERDGA